MIPTNVRALALFAALSVASAANAQNLDPSGVWLTEKGDAKVRVSRCGAGLCGVVTWLRDPIDQATGKPQRDDKNKNARLATRPVIGINLFSGMKPNGSNAWSGQIYNADDGGTYASNVTVLSADRLRVEGCVGALCGAESWTRTK